MKLFVPLTVMLLSATLRTSAQNPNNGQGQRPTSTTSVYTGSGYDFAMLSTALLERPGEKAQLTIPRFTALVNVGLNIHLDFSRHFGLFTGLGFKNIGFIEKFDDEDSTIKRRVYSIGIPLGFKFGDMRNRSFVFFGGGLDFPFHYRERRWVTRSDKQKLGEWFSNHTPRVMPYVFIGHSFDPGVTIKLQYYPNNFLNPNYGKNKPFDGYQVNLMFISVGIDIHYRQGTIQERDYQRNKDANKNML